ncbi:hypothetical protein JKP88DRAFT_273076 [Tribonema minus]|uniref:Uncharacterized protein n=1 Tax=Tribonema minus TaxID=303371 RepID=A0A836CGN7_9STRA|nr:hypothetical protein JKP88DRAFT_273076 [Tribonema minus]
MTTVLAGAVLGTALFRVLSASSAPRYDEEGDQDDLEALGAANAVEAEELLQEPAMQQQTAADARAQADLQTSSAAAEPAPALARVPALLPSGTGWEPPAMLAPITDIDNEYQDFMGALMQAERERTQDMRDRLTRMQDAAKTSEFERQRQIFEAPPAANREPPACETPGVRGPGWLTQVGPRPAKASGTVKQMPSREDVENSAQLARRRAIVDAEVASGAAGTSRFMNKERPEHQEWTATGLNRNAQPGRDDFLLVREGGMQVPITARGRSDRTGAAWHEAGPDDHARRSEGLQYPGPPGPGAAMMALAGIARSEAATGARRSASMTGEVAGGRRALGAGSVSGAVRQVPHAKVDTHMIERGTAQMSLGSARASNPHLRQRAETGVGAGPIGSVRRGALGAASARDAGLAGRDDAGMGALQSAAGWRSGGTGGAASRDGHIAGRDDVGVRIRDPGATWAPPSTAGPAWSSELRTAENSLPVTDPRSVSNSVAQSAGFVSRQYAFTGSKERLAEGAAAMRMQGGVKAAIAAAPMEGAALRQRANAPQGYAHLTGASANAAGGGCGTSASAPPSQTQDLRQSVRGDALHEVGARAQVGSAPAVVSGMRTDLGLKEEAAAADRDHATVGAVLRQRRWRHVPGAVAFSE